MPGLQDDRREGETEPFAESQTGTESRQPAWNSSPARDQKGEMLDACSEKGTQKTSASVRQSESIQTTLVGLDLISDHRSKVTIWAIIVQSTADC